MLERLLQRGKTVKVDIEIKSKNLGTVTSRNIIFDITGSEKPNEIVLLSGHMDSWDVGQGALDDGGGMAAVWQAMLSLKQLAEKNPSRKEPFAVSSGPLKSKVCSELSAIMKLPKMGMKLSSSFLKPIKALSVQEISNQN